MKDFVFGDVRLPARFWEKVTVNTETDCWEWRAYRNACGYAWFRWDGKAQLGHRVTFAEFVGPLLTGYTLDHLCRVRRCVRPDHLEQVTPGVNTLRGDTIQARNAVKTHCVHGHEFTPENTALYRGHRACRTCHKLKNRAARARKAAA